MEALNPRISNPLWLSGIQRKTLFGKLRSKDISVENSKQILLNLVERYEKGHGEINKSINRIELNMVEMKADMKAINCRLDNLAETAKTNQSNISKLQESERADESLRQKIENLTSTASKIYIPIIIALLLSSIYGAWEFFKEYLRR